MLGGYTLDAPTGSGYHRRHTSDGRFGGRNAYARRTTAAEDRLAHGGALDNLTHSLVGAAIGKAGAERLTPLATATLVVAANAPDVDMVSFARGEYFALAFRRGITHGWPALLVLPFAVTGVMTAWDRWVRRRRDPDAPAADARWLLVLSGVGLVTHPSLDWLNIYGMRWSMPFDDTWTYGDSLFIIDPWVWLLLGGAVFLASDPGARGRLGWGLLAVLTTLLVVLGVGGWPAALWSGGLAGILVARLRSGSAGPSGGGGPRRWGGRRSGLVSGALLVVSAYIAVLTVADQRARDQVRVAASATGLMPEDVLVAPVRGRPHLAEVEVQTAEGYVPGSFDWLGEPRVELRPADIVPLLDAPDLPAATLDRIVEAARRRPDIRNYSVWTRFPYVRVRPDAEGWQVRFGDARYDSQPEAAGLAGVTVHVPASEVR